MDQLALNPEEQSRINGIIETMEREMDDDSESIITNERYNSISRIIKDAVVKASPGSLTGSDRIDRIITNRWLGLPIFAVVMWAVYYISIQTIGAWGTDWANDTFFGEWVPEWVGSLLENAGCAPWLESLIQDGVIAGVGAVLGFLPQMAVLFLCLGILEDCGYMARVAFIMDRIFRKFGLSGKSFIPMLVSMGCGVPGVMATRTIENEKDRRMTIMTTTFIPCGAKTPIIALIAGAFFPENSWVAPGAYSHRGGRHHPFRPYSEKDCHVRRGSHSLRHGTSHLPHPGLEERHHSCMGPLQGFRTKKPGPSSLCPAP